MGIETQLRRAIAVFRFAALGYPVVLFAIGFDALARPVAALALVAAIAAWTAFVSYVYARRGWPPVVLYADLAATAAVLAVSAWAFAGVGRSVPMSVGPWLAGAVLAWAVAGGRRRGVVAGVVVAGVGMAFRGGLTENTFSEAALLILSGLMVGHLTRMGVEAEERLRAAAERTAAVRERERLARGIHDSVLQVLALVQRRGAAIGGEAAELGRLAGAQEAALRSLISSSSYRNPLDGRLDVRELLNVHAGDSVTVAAPAVPVELPTEAARELAAAVASAVDNVRAHCPEGTQTWLLVEDDREAVTVTVRDDGPGLEPGRLEAAARQGRLGVAQSIRGRIRELGGAVAIESSPGEGTELEIMVPRAPRKERVHGDTGGGR
jgi:signal transduction histidine kinase